MKIPKFIQKYIEKREMRNTLKNFYNLNIEEDKKYIDFTLGILDETNDYESAIKLALANGLIKQTIEYSKKSNKYYENKKFLQSTIIPKNKLSKNLANIALENSKTEKTKLISKKINLN